MVDLKKLIAIFLVLASTTSILVLALSVSPLQSGVVAYDAQKINSDEYTSAPKNAFPVDQPVASNESTGLTNSNDGTPQITPSSNLTESVAQSLALEMMRLNPNGPKNVNGQTTITPPDPTDVMKPLETNGPLKNLTIPDWNADSAKIIVADNYTTGDLANYDNSLNEIANKYFVDSSLADAATNQSLTADNINDISQALAGASKELSSITVPKPLAAFHKSFLNLLSYENNAAALAQNANDDPMKASIIFKAQEQKFYAVITEFQTELGKVRALKNVSGNKPLGALSFIDKIFGVNKAYALFGLGDITFDPAIFARMIWEFLSKTILQILKNLLINQIENQVLNFVQGGGKPMFITNWKNFLTGTVKSATNAALMKDVVPTLCPTYATQVLSSLGVFNARFIGGPAGGCPRDQLLAKLRTNPSAFYTNFDNGGWDAYSVVLQNNVYLATIDANDKIMKAASDAESAAKTKSVANQGYKGQEVCADGSDPNGVTSSCTNPVNGDTTNMDSSGNCPAGYIPNTSSNNGSCADGSEPYSNSTGQSTGASLHKALGSSIDLIVNADDITGLAVAAAESLMIRLINTGVGALTNLGQAPKPTTPPPQIPGTSCTPATQQASVGTSTIFIAGGGDGNYTWSSTSGNAPANTGPTYQVVFNTSGIFSVTVTSAGTSATCTATIQ